MDAAGAVPAGVLEQTFGCGPDAAWRYDAQAVTGMARGDAACVPLAGSSFDNAILGLAAAAGVGALFACGLDAAEITRGLRAFQPLPHRLQRVAERGGVRFVDDSKATSLAAMAAALRMVDAPVRLIAGGRLKEHDLESIKELLTRQVRKVYLIGEATRQMEAAWRDAVACEACGTMEAAVARATIEACAGETVLLSPGCASFDQFVNYKERGERFSRLAREVAAT
jgi:UDP-N-acetylmuramoylalanine--D-glutamate ligase